MALFEIALEMYEAGAFQAVTEEQTITVNTDFSPGLIGCVCGVKYQADIWNGRHNLNVVFVVDNADLPTRSLAEALTAAHLQFAARGMPN